MIKTRRKHTRDLNTGKRREAGIALMLALVFIVILTVLVTSFTYEAQVDATAIGMTNNDFEALLAARSALAEALSILEADLLNNDTRREEGEVTEIFDSLEDIWAEQSGPTESGGAMGQTIITDEYSKINLNALIFEDVDEEVYFHLEMALRVLFSERGMIEDPVDAILDWLDSDDIVRPQGYESTFYSSLENPYQAKNGPMDTIEELLLIPGITADVYFGTGEEAQIPLPELLTVHGHPQGMVNVNTAPQEVLVALLAARDDPENPDVAGAREAASLLMELMADQGPFLSLPQDLNPVPDPPDPENNNNGNPDPDTPQPLPAANFFDIKSSVFRIQSDAVSGDAQVRLQAYVWRATDEFAAEAGGGDAQQMFRVIEWQVIR